MADSPAIEFGTLYKFMISSGVLLIASAGVGCWAFLQSSAVLELQADEIAELTAAGASGVATQQTWLTWLVTWLPVGAIALMCIGLALIVGGVIWWRPLQILSDERDRRTFERDFPTATASEIRKAAVDEATRDIKENSQQDRKSHIEGDAEANDPFEPREDLNNRAADAISVESTLQRLFFSAFVRTHEVRQDVTVPDQKGSRFIIDLLLRSKRSDRGNYAVEFKLLQPGAPLRRIRETIQLTEYAAELIGDSVNERVDAYVIFIVDAESQIEHFDSAVLPTTRSHTRVRFLTRDEISSATVDPRQLL